MLPTRWCVVAVLLARACAQEVQYTIEFPNAAHHEAEIEARFEGAPPILEARMSRSSPGRYAMHEFARNVYNVRVTDGAGRPLSFTRPNAHQWNVTGHDGTVVVRYTLFGDTSNGTYVSIKSTRAVLNAPATWMWARGLEQRPAVVTVKPPAGSQWKAASQLQPVSEMRFRAPHLQYLLDSPLLVGEISIDEWRAGDAKMRLALAHSGSDAERSALTEIVKAGVIESEGVFGELPTFDFGTYTFLVDIQPGNHNNGMEHRNSTMLTSYRSLKDVRAAPVTFPHEFLHVWNVERIRPRSLEPFHFEDTNISEELWFAEGFTSYYASLISRRAGLFSLDMLVRGLSNELNAVILSRGREVRSAVEMSQYAPFSDRGAGGGTVTYVPDNAGNTFLTYYTYGFALGLGIDLSIRAEFPGKSADDWMRVMWTQYGRAQKDYAPAKAYTLADLESTLASVTNAEFASRMFRLHIRGKELMPYEALLGRAGLLLRPAKPESAWLGHSEFTFSDAGAVVSAGTLRATPLYAAGLDRGDRIVQLDGKPMRSQQALSDWLKGKKPGERAMAKVEMGGRTRDVEIILAANPSYEVVTFEQAKLQLNPEASAFRLAWLSSKAKRPLPELRRYCSQCRRAHPFEFDNCPYDGKPLELALP